MAKKKRGRKMPAWKKWVRVGLGIAGSVIGTVIATKPLHRGLTSMSAGNFATGVNEVMFDVGLIEVGGSTSVNVQKVIGVGLTAGVGLGIIMLFRYLAKRV